MNYLKWTVGDIEIIQIVEMVDNTSFNTFIPEAKPDTIKTIQWLVPHFADRDGHLKAQVQSFLIRSGNRNILIDTCNGNGKERPGWPTWGNLHTDYLKKLDRCGVKPEDINIVACTHLHFDHVGWNTVQKGGKWLQTFPNATYLFSKEEYDYWVQKPKKEAVDDLNGIDDSVLPIAEAGLMKLVSDDYRIDENIRFIPTPGHTPHHVSVVVESQGKKAVITGDLLHHPCQIAYPEWTTSSDTIPDLAVETRQKFFREVTDTQTLIIGSHFADPVAGLVITVRNESMFSPR